MTFTGSLGSGFDEMKKVALNPLPLIVILFILHVWMPVVAFGAGKLFYANSPYFITGIVLEFIVPTGITSLVWVSMYRGNTVLSLSVILLDTLLTPFLIPLSLKLFVGTAVDIDALGMFRDLILMIFIPALIAMTLNQLTKGNIKKILTPKLAPFSKAAIIVVVALNSTKIAHFFKEFTPTLIGIAVTILLLAITGYVFGWIASRILKQKYPNTASMTINSGMRNISTGAVLASQYFPGEVMFPVMIGTLFQQVLVSIVVSILSRSESKKGNLS
jgi:predicted Na+-dependent transporter